MAASSFARADCWALKQQVPKTASNSSATANRGNFIKAPYETSSLERPLWTVNSPHPRAGFLPVDGVLTKPTSGVNIPSLDSSIGNHYPAKCSLRRNMFSRFPRATSACALGLSLLLPLSAFSADETEHKTTTPIKHLVVIFQENVSFDHYFATYPVAADPAGEPRFVAKHGTPTVNGLSGALLTNNPNLVNPFRFDRSQAATCDQDHNYTDEQKAMDSGLMDKFVQTVGNGPGTDGTLTCNKTDVMGYFDGNTTTAIWNYAQHFAMNQNSYGTTFGPSSPGAINLVSGETGGAVGVSGNFSGDLAGGSLISDAQPAFDKCDSRETVMMTGKNIGDLLTAKGITWGFFQGGFADCKASHTGSDGKPKGDYIPHHQPFQYYTSTANPSHLGPSSAALIGQNADQANHQYDFNDFWTAVNSGNFPEVSFLKAPGYLDGHAGYSDPLAEQGFIVGIIN